MMQLKLPPCTLHSLLCSGAIDGKQHPGRYRNTLHSMSSSALTYLSRHSPCIEHFVQVRLMAKEHLGRYRNTFHCLSEVLKAEGPTALFIGLVPTLLR